MTGPEHVKYRSWQWRTIFEIVTTVVMLALAAVLVLQNFRVGTSKPRAAAIPLPSQPIVVRDSPTLGNRNARVALIEYSDFECPFCGRVARDVLPSLIQRFVETGRVLLIFKYFPLDIHPNAQKAAAAAFCAGAQGKFWSAHDSLFAQPKLATDALGHLAEKLGLNLPAYEACRSDKAAAVRIKNDKTEAEALGLSGTPTFFVGTLEVEGSVHVVETLLGAKPIEDFTKALEHALK